LQAKIIHACVHKNEGGFLLSRKFIVRYIGAGGRLMRSKSARSASQ